MSETSQQKKETPLKCHVHTRSDFSLCESLQKKITALAKKSCYIHDYECYNNGYWQKRAQFMLILKRGENLVGISEFLIDSDECELLWMCGPGYGKSMMMKLETYLRKKEIKKITLHFAEYSFAEQLRNGNKSRRAFYEKMGFIVTESKSCKIASLTLTDWNKAEKVL